MAWAAVAGAAVSVAGGMISGSKARKAQQQQDMRRMEAARGNTASIHEYSRQLGGLADRYENYAMQPTSSANGYGTSNIDPRTGQTGFQLNGTYAGFRNQAFDQARGAFGLAGNLDPRAHAAERYDAAQALLAPGDARAESGLMQDLYNKGGFGLRTNGGTNPYVATLLDARNTRNSQMSYNSLREGEMYLDNLLNRGKGMYDMGQGIDNLGNLSMQDALARRSAFSNDFKGMLGMRNAQHEQVLAGDQVAHNAWAGGDPGFGANQQSQQWAAGANQLGGMIKGADWSKLFGGGGDRVGGASGMTSAPIFDGGVMRSAPIYG